MSGRRAAVSSKPGTDGRRPVGRRTPAFDKGQATLWLLTLALGLGFGASVRVLKGAQAAPRAATTLAGAATPTARSAFGAASPRPDASVGRVVLLPQRTYRSRARTRAS
jgi:hypothetical protein